MVKVDVDEVWATPSTLHVRVHVRADDGTWRHKYYCSVPLSEVPEEALVMMIQRYMDEVPEEDHQQTALF